MKLHNNHIANQFHNTKQFRKKLNIVIKAPLPLYINTSDNNIANTSAPALNTNKAIIIKNSIQRNTRNGRQYTICGLKVKNRQNEYVKSRKVSYVPFLASPTSRELRIRKFVNSKDNHTESFKSARLMQSKNSKAELMIQANNESCYEAQTQTTPKSNSIKLRILTMEAMNLNRPTTQISNYKKKQSQAKQTCKKEAEIQQTASLYKKRTINDMLRKYAIESGNNIEAKMKIINNVGDFLKYGNITKMRIAKIARKYL